MLLLCACGPCAEDTQCPEDHVIQVNETVPSQRVKILDDVDEIPIPVSSLSRIESGESALEELKREFNKSKTDEDLKAALKQRVLGPELLAKSYASEGGRPMRKSTSDAVSSPIKRSEKRATTAPAMMCVRRGDYNLSASSLEVLKRVHNSTIHESMGSAAVADNRLEKQLKAAAIVVVWGCLAEDQKPQDERPLKWIGGEKFPGPDPPEMSCRKGCKGGKSDGSPNQDNFSITYFKNGWKFICCLDGHGPCGHFVSSRAVQTIPYFLSLGDPDFSKVDVSELLKESFRLAQKDLEAVSWRDNWNLQASGSAAVAALWKGKTVYTANAGDSRCIIASEKGVIFETMDHKPDLPEERDRIEDAGGEIIEEEYPDGWIDRRIFIRGQDYPGLTMTRSLGDNCLKDHGVIAVPDVECTQADEKDEPFMLLGSDGVWEFLESGVVSKAISKTLIKNGSQKTVLSISRLATEKWKEMEGDYCDDITAILVSLF